MIRIICPNCKDAYLENKDNCLVCPSCSSSFEEENENLFLGIQYYNESDYDKANDCLMKFIVKNGADARAIFYKALADGFCFDEDTLTLNEIYTKLLEALADLPDELFPQYVAIANDEAEKLEKAVAQAHIYLFADADAEKIKKEVSTIINLQNDAKAFRVRLNALVNEFNDRSALKISAKFSECFLVEPELATQVGDMKFNKITENIASHTVFTGILSTDIKNLEIYYRCIVMFFKKNRAKYLFLDESAKKFTELAQLLEEGQYYTIKGTSTIGDKLKAASIDFFQESLKDSDEEFQTQAETVVIIASEPEAVEEQEAEIEDISSTTENVTEALSESAEETEISTEEETEIHTTVAINMPADDTIKFNKVEEKTEETAEEIIEVEAAEETETFEETEETQEETEAVVVEEIAAEESSTEQGASDTAATEIPTEAQETEDAPQKFENVDVAPEIVETEDAKVKGRTHKKSYGPFIAAFLILAGIIAIICFTVIPEKINESNYNQAAEHMSNKEYELAVDVYAELGDYEDSADKLKLAKYNLASQLEAQENYNEAKKIYTELGNYEDSMAKASSCTYNIALAMLDGGKFDEAKKLFESIPDYLDSKEKSKECDYQKGISYIDAKEYATAIDIFTALGDYSESKTKILDAKYKYVSDHPSKDDKTTIAYLKDLIEARYLDSVALRRKILGENAVVGGVSTCINYEKGDTATDLTEVDKSKPIYFHITVSDPELYGKKLTAKFTTSVGYTERKTITLTKADNTYALMYPKTSISNYTVEFSLSTADGTELSKQTVTIK